MLVVLPFHNADLPPVRRLLAWIKQLGSCKEHNCLFVVDQAVAWTEVFKLRALAEGVFGKVNLACNEKSVIGWPQGPNSLFLVAAKEIESHELGAWLWLEPDAVPLAQDWLGKLELLYNLCDFPFVGAIAEGVNSETGLPTKHFAGVGIYPQNTWSRLAKAIQAQPTKAFDVSTTELVLPNAANTNLIQHIWGENGNPPTFRERNEPGTNVFALRQIQKGAVLFHRCKDSSLIDLKRRDLFPYCQSELAVVIPFCNRDAEMFIKNLRWWRELQQTYPYTAVLSCEQGTRREFINEMVANARCFRSFALTEYTAPKPGQWPPTVAFIAAAKAMVQFGVPWLWTEFDMIPLKSEWLDALSSEYTTGAKSFMGPIVPHLTHMNGTGIYPADTPQRIPKGLAQIWTAWDVAMRPEMINDCHDCSHIFQHVWGVHQGRFHPYLGDPPSFPIRAMMGQIDKDAVVFHRCKDGTLIDRLREMKHQ